MLAERGVARIGRVDEVVAFVESPPRFDVDQLGPRGRRHLELSRERDLETGFDNGGIRLRVVKDRPIAVAGQEDGPPTAVCRQVAPQRPAQLLVCPECRCRVTAGRHQEVEGVAGHDEGAGAFAPLESAGELH